MPEDLILSSEPLSFPWACLDPFLFCVHHNDRFPAGNAEMGPAASLRGRDLGQDFAFKDGWNMYHGQTVPGFPQHPHRGFEVVTVVPQGLIDHADSLGAAARYGDGDVQWLTAGAGIVHSEMFPLLRQDQPNPVELFQIWLNLPAAQKMARPEYTMFWAAQQPRLNGDGSSFTLVAGSLDGTQAPPPPKESFASNPRSELLIAYGDIQANGKRGLPAASAGVNRCVYLFEGALRLDGRTWNAPLRLVLKADRAVDLVGAKPALSAGSPGPAVAGGAKVLILQGRPLGEPVASYGPFVMNTKQELMQAFEDYQRTQFGGWPWDTDDPVHPREAGRFARHPDGREEKP
jgi:redox-sensitive bicupin YhaK (pirin superfamily)